MQENLRTYIDKYKRIISDHLSESLHDLSVPTNLKESMIYSVEAGGKKLRPILLIASFDAYGKDIDKIISAALAVEMVHTYSLIHDDLPAMDNDDFRRGKPTNHKMFDEATAILAGDALLTYSFELIAKDTNLDHEQRVNLISMLANASGPKGMVGGQVLDMEAEQHPITLAELEGIHTLKTGELLQFAIYAGAYLGGATKDQLQHLKDFAYYLGLIFQVQDDILDVTGDPDKLGKPIGSDEGNKKSTYPKLLGVNGAIEQKKLYVKQAKNALTRANAQSSILMDLTDYFSQRDH